MDVPFQLAIDRQVLLPDRFLYRLGSGIDGPLLLIQGRIRGGHAVDQLGSVEPDIPFPLAEAGSRVYIFQRLIQISPLLGLRRSQIRTVVSVMIGTVQIPVGRIRESGDEIIQGSQIRLRVLRACHQV